MPISCLITLPVYNEGKCIRQVCEEWLQLAATYPEFRVLIVDDGSKDNTAAVLAEIARTNSSLTVITQKNAGHGAAVRRAYTEALAMDCEWVFQLDSDRQFTPADFALLWGNRGRSRFILGDRHSRKDLPVRVLLSRMHRALLLAIFGAAVRDPNIPYRLMKASLLRELLPLVPSGCFAPNVLLSLLAQRAGEDLCHLPVTHHPRQSGTGSITGLKIARIGLRWAVELLRFRCREFATFSAGDREASVAALSRTN